MKKTSLLIFLIFLTTLGNLMAQTDQYFYFYNNWQGPDRVLTVLEDNSVVMDVRTDRPEQQWAEVRDEVNGRWYLKNKSKGDSYLLQFGNDKNDANELIMAVKTEKDNQLWALAGQYTDGTKKIYVASLGKEYVIDCDQNPEGPVVFMAPSSNASGQYWHIVPVTNETIKMQKDAPSESTVVATPAFEDTWHPDNDRKRVPAEITEKEEETLKQYAKKIFFNSGKSSFKEGTTDYLDKIAGFMRAHPDAIFEIEGYTDTTGRESTNQKLTNERANAVKEYLKSKNVTNPLTSIGYGENHPIASNNTRKGRAQNRRVEIKLISK